MTDRPNAIPLTQDDVRQVAERIDAIEEKVDALWSSNEILAEIFRNTQRIAEILKVNQAHSKESFSSVSRQIVTGFSEISQQIKEISGFTGQKMGQIIGTLSMIGAQNSPSKGQAPEKGPDARGNGHSVGSGQMGPLGRADGDACRPGFAYEAARLIKDQRKIQHIDRREDQGEIDPGAWQTTLTTHHARKVTKARICDLPDVKPDLRLAWIQDGIETIGDLMDEIDKGSPIHSQETAVWVLKTLGFKRPGDS